MKVCGRCGRENPEESRFCGYCGASLETTAAREERKIVTVLFADLVDFTSRAERMDPEDVRAILSHRRRAPSDRRGIRTGPELVSVDPAHCLRLGAGSRRGPVCLDEASSPNAVDRGRRGGGRGKPRRSRRHPGRHRSSRRGTLRRLAAGERLTEEGRFADAAAKFGPCLDFYRSVDAVAFIQKTEALLRSTA